MKIASYNRSLTMACWSPIVLLLLAPAAGCASGSEPSRPGDLGSGVGGDGGSPDGGGNEDAADVIDAPDSNDAQEAANDGDSCGTGPIGEVGQPCCTSDELACAGHANSQILICDPASGTWAALKTCSGVQLCDTTEGPLRFTCRDQVPECIGKQPGDGFCDGKVLIECGPDLVTSQNTSCEFACVGDACGGACTPGERQCQGRSPRQCTSDSMWHTEQPCEFVCTGQGTCGGVCVPGFEGCAGQIPRTCDDAGQWQNGSECVSQACVSGSCKGVCEPGRMRCVGNTTQDCNIEGQWRNGAACPGVCVDGACCPSTLSAGEELKRGKFLCSPNGFHRFGLDMQGNLLLLSDDKFMWSSGAHCAAQLVKMQADGNFVVQDGLGVALWSSQTAPHPGARLVVQDDGHVWIRQNNIDLWSIPSGGAGLKDVCFAPDADSYVDVKNSNSNFGVSNTLLVDLDPIVYRSILRFTVPTFAANSQKPTLRLFVTDPSTDGPKVYLTNDPWTETEVTWNNQPGSPGLPLADFASLGLGWKSVGLTSAIVGAGEYSFLLWPDVAEGADFSSREGDNPPELTLKIPEDIDECPSDPTKTEGICN